MSPEMEASLSASFWLLCMVLGALIVIVLFWFATWVTPAVYFGVLWGGAALWVWISAYRKALKRRQDDYRRYDV